MAGKRMKLKMDMKVFTFSPVDRRVIKSWEQAIDIAQLRFRLAEELKKVAAETLWIRHSDSRQLASIAAICEWVNPGCSLLIHVCAGKEFDIFERGQSQFMTWDIHETAESEIDKGVWFLMLINTYRTMIQGLVGPAIGFNFNITIAGVIATCLRLGVPCEFESE